MNPALTFEKASSSDLKVSPGGRYLVLALNGAGKVHTLKIHDDGTLEDTGFEASAPHAAAVCEIR